MIVYFKNGSYYTRMYELFNSIASENHNIFNYKYDLIKKYFTIKSELDKKTNKIYKLESKINMLEKENTRLYNIIINNRNIVEKEKEIVEDIVEIKEIDLKIIINSDDYEFI